MTMDCYFKDIDASLQKQCLIGEGTYARVYNIKGGLYACKHYRLNDFDDHGICCSIIREISALKSLKTSPYVIDCVRISFNNQSRCLIMPLFSWNLKQVIKDHQSLLNAETIKSIMFQIFYGLYDAFALGILHRDLKPENILVSENFQVTICDWGLSRFTSCDNGQTSCFSSSVQTLWYRSPEILLGMTSYGTAIDIWSAGVILCQLLTGHIFLPGDSEIDQLFRIFRILGTPDAINYPSIAHLIKPEWPVWKKKS